MRSISITVVSVLVVWAVAVGATVGASDMDQPDTERIHLVCFPDGTWLGESPAWGLTWLVEYTSTSYRRGSLVLRFVGGDPSVGGYFPAESLSSTYGTWVRTGPRSFDYTMIHYGLAPGGQQPVTLLKSIGSVEITDECDRLEVTNHSSAFYDPTQDPFGDVAPAYGCIEDGSLSPARRIPVQEPCQAPQPDP